jgi:hypothetical protein
MSNDSLPISDLISSPSIKFDTVGDRVSGVITAVRRQQQTDFDTGEALSWSNGDPRMMTVVRLEVDGEERALYARGGKYEVVEGEGTSLESAIVDAVVAAGGTAIERGARLEVVHSGLGKAPKRGANAPKLYRAKYTPAAASVPVSDLFSEE